MKSKTKSLKKGNYIPGNATPAPAKKAENKNATPVASKNHPKRDKRKEFEARSRARRMRSMLKQGMTQEQIEKIFAQENNRMVLVLLNNGFADAKKYVDNNKLTLASNSKNAIWILTDKDNVDAVVEKVKVLGRVSVTKPEQKAEKKAKNKKPTNNTAEAKKSAKTTRKTANKSNAEMRPYYAALRKGGVSKRIKKYNKTLADKIEAWLKERKKTEAEKTDRIDKHKRDHRQMSSMEVKTNKRARKAAKHLASQERCKAAQKKREENNAKERAKRAQKAQKPVQTELKMAA